MSRLPDDLRLDDMANGPEFSTRIMSTMAKQGITTIGQLRRHLDELPKWRGLGNRSVREIREYFLHNDSDESLFETEECRRYRLEDVLGSTFALMHDVQNHLVRAALRGRVTTETRNHLKLKLLDAAKRIEQLPTYTGD
jgi:hypothetical protein